MNWKAVATVLIGLAVWFMVIQPLLSGEEMFGGLLGEKKAA